MEDKNLKANLLEERENDVNPSTKPNIFQDVNDTLRIQEGLIIKSKTKKLQEVLNRLYQDIWMA